MHKHLLLISILIISLSNLMISIEDAHSEGPIIIFDKPTYNPFDTMKILIADPSSNIDRGRSDVIQAIVYTESNVGNIFEFTEVAPDSGVFQTLVTLTPDQKEWPADLVVQKGDRLFIIFSSEAGTTTSSIDVDFDTDLVLFDKIQYTADERVTIFVLDISENKDPDNRDDIDLRVWSTTDIKGLTIQLREIGTDSGVFTSRMILTEDQSSSDIFLKVSSSDVLTAKYTERAGPSETNPDGSQTEEENLFGAALVAPKKTQIEHGPPSGPEIVGQFGNPVKDVEVGRQVVIQDNVVNKQNTNLRFAYIVLIKDPGGITVSLSWLTGEVPPSSTFEAGQSWAPTDPGAYNIVIFLWQSIDNPIVLAPQKTLNVIVTYPLG